MAGCGDYELRDILRKRLFERRYVIVLDDIWSTKVWDVIRICFPDNNNESRILITTRESDVAERVAGLTQLILTQIIPASVRG